MSNNPAAAPDDVTQFRDAVADDSASLALLADAATRRLNAWSWDQEANAGQSSFEIGRTTIASATDTFLHLAHWRVAITDGRVAGALNSYLMPAPNPGAAPVVEVLRPPTELKAIAQGVWYISVASVFPEFRGQGVGHAILAEAERLAPIHGATRLALLVGSFNPGAKSLYERQGFSEWERRTFVPFPGSDPVGDWILMAKDLSP